MAHRIRITNIGKRDSVFAVQDAPEGGEPVNQEIKPGESYEMWIYEDRDMSILEKNPQAPTEDDQ